MYALIWKEHEVCILQINSKGISSVVICQIRKFLLLLWNLKADYSVKTLYLDPIWAIALKFKFF
jgi:hypothetical protein